MKHHLNFYLLKTSKALFRTSPYARQLGLYPVQLRDSAAPVEHSEMYLRPAKYYAVGKSHLMNKRMVRFLKCW